ncbi:hypothetical protein D3227_20610 [Mesorhizobium waimense]|uniref:Uncharacterized protein n=1 Tax=Mesorhizobium waimense TaxID=1300307 RepID=A0A3A5KJT7_9HYPH|nr:hypothetical protein [Mesorhizobium waimense]RJT36119.1 hypothetical protein D3227_20610 [Mesorhizobium waimense]
MDKKKRRPSHEEWKAHVRNIVVDPDPPRLLTEDERALLALEHETSERQPASKPSEGDALLGELLHMLVGDADEGSSLTFTVKLLEIVDHFNEYSKRNDDFRVSRMSSALEDISKGAASLGRLIKNVVEQLDAIGKKAGEPLDDFVMLALRSEIEELLRQTSHSAQAARGDLVKKYGTGNPDMPDRGSGGGRGLHAHLYGSPKQKFVRHLSFLWNIEAGHDLTSSPTGRFAQFVRLAYIFATGADPENAGLKDDIGLAVKAMKTRERIRGRAAEHFSKSLELRAIGRIKEADFMALRAERLSSWLAIPRFERKAKIRTTLSK